MTRGLLLELPRNFPHWLFISIRQGVAELLFVPLYMLGVGGRLLLGHNGSNRLPSAVQMLWMHHASSPHSADDLYQKEFQLQREQGNYFYQGRWVTAAEFGQVVQQKRRERKILLVDVWLLFGAMAAVALLLFWILWLFMAA